MKNRNILSTAFQNRALILELTKRDFFLRYKKSFFGAFWAILNPLILLLLYFTFFGVILNMKNTNEAYSHPYIIVMFSGLIIFNLFADIFIRSTSIIYSNPNFVKKIVFPLELLSLVIILCALAYTFIDILVFSFLFYVFSNTINFYLIFSLFVIIFLIPLLWAISLILSALGVFFYDTNNIIRITNQILLYTAPIFYTLDRVPNEIKSYVYLNPLTFIIDAYQKFIFLGIFPNNAFAVIFFIFSLIFFYFSTLFFNKIKKYFPEHI